MNDYDLIEWSDTMLTGVDEIDRQHKWLVSIINEANAKLKVNHNAKALDNILVDLEAYTIYHFATEEALMLKYHYITECNTEAEEHRQQHRQFSARIAMIRSDLKRGIKVTNEVLLSFLNNWLVHHILNIDKHLGSFIVSKRI